VIADSAAFLSAHELSQRLLSGRLGWGCRIAAWGGSETEGLGTSRSYT